MSTRSLASAAAPASASVTAIDDVREFRNALGRFATGIAVVTLETSAGRIGLTVNSFNSVSLTPPLVVWSLARTSPSLPAFEASQYYAINVLAVDQEEISNRFAGKQPDRFAGLELETGLGGAPLLSGVCARFQVRNTTRHDGGDHVVFIGEVERFDYDDSREPLLYFAGRYRRLDAD
ncbi:MAG: flavin reductase family protein [Azoarcus sp.]|jgi:flavin reductase (DIM6/NTAB) family NADH-FMN oxidoreductase RutF|nr:flavin reductase family protein [Azoarcus sp.]